MSKLDGCAKPLVPAPTVTSTQENKLRVAAREPFGAVDVIRGAIELLPHLIEAVNGAGSVGVVGEEIAVGQLEGTGRQRIDVR